MQGAELRKYGGLFQRVCRCIKYVNTEAHNIQKYESEEKTEVNIQLITTQQPTEYTPNNVTNNRS